MQRLQSATLLVPVSISRDGKCGGGRIRAQITGLTGCESSLIFYMHGRWVEMNGQSDNRAQGLCDYDDIISKFAKHGLVVIGLEHPNDTRIIKYAQKIAAQVPQLLDKGATAERIAVSKHSKGGSIVILAAGLLNDPRINYAILASCGKDGTRYARQQCKRIEKNVQQL